MSPSQAGCKSVLGIELRIIDLSELGKLQAYADLEADARDRLNRECGLVIPEAPKMDDDAALADSLDRTSLSGWRDALDAVSQRQANSTAVPPPRCRGPSGTA
jgi:hypothetical protein